MPVEITLEEEAGVPVDLTNFSVYADACKFPSAPASFSLNPVVTSAVSGIITLGEMTPSGTMLLEVGNYTWDLILQNSDGQRLGPYVEGSITVTSINTKP